MILDNPDDDRKMREAFHTLTTLTRNNDEFYLLISVIRMFHEVKAEYEAERAERNSKPQLQLVKNKAN